MGISRSTSSFGLVGGQFSGYLNDCCHKDAKKYGNKSMTNNK